MELKFTINNASPAILELEEEEWSFCIHLNSRSDADNILLISNTLYNLDNGEYIINFFNSVKDIPYEDITNVELYNGEILLFDASSLNLNYAHMFIDYKYNSNMIQVGMQDRGLSYGIVFRQGQQLRG